MKAAEKSHIILIGATRLTPDFLKKPMEASDNGKPSLKPLNPWREVTAHLGFHIWWTIFQTWRWNENIFRETKTDRIYHQQNSLKLEKGKWSRWKPRSGERNASTEDSEMQLHVSWGPLGALWWWLVGFATCGRWRHWDGRRTEDTEEVGGVRVVMSSHHHRRDKDAILRWVVLSRGCTPVTRWHWKDSTEPTL